MGRGRLLGLNWARTDGRCKEHRAEEPQWWRFQDEGESVGLLAVRDHGLPGFLGEPWVYLVPK